MVYCLVKLLAKSALAISLFNIFVAKHFVCSAWSCAATNSLSVSAFRSPFDSQRNVSSSLINCLSIFLMFCPCFTLFFHLLLILLLLLLLDYTLCDNLPLSHMISHRRTAKFEVPKFMTIHTSIHENNGNVFLRHAKPVATRQNVLYSTKRQFSEPDNPNTYFSCNLKLSSDSAVRV